jgi:hypothetical protein
VVAVALHISPRWSALTYPLVAVMATLSLGFCWSVRIDERVEATVRFDSLACVEDPFPSDARPVLRVGAELRFTPLGSARPEVVVADRIEGAAQTLQLCAHPLHAAPTLAGLAGTLSLTLGRARLLYSLCPRLKALLGG